MGKVTFETDLKKNERLSISSVVSNEIVPPFCCLGLNEAHPSGVPGYPELFEVFKELSQRGHWLLWTLAKNRNLNDNTAQFIPQNRAEEIKTARAYQELNKLQLVCRIKRGHYFINPKVLFPKRGNFKKVLDPWRTLIKQTREEPVK